MRINMEVDITCRYCGCGSEKTDIYLVIRNNRFEGFCLSCYEEHLDDKRQSQRGHATQELGSEDEGKKGQARADNLGDELPES